MRQRKGKWYTEEKYVPFHAKWSVEHQRAMPLITERKFELVAAQVDRFIGRKRDRKKIVGLIREIGARSWNSKYKKKKKKLYNFKFPLWICNNNRSTQKYTIIAINDSIIPFENSSRKIHNHDNYFTLFFIKGIILKNLQRNELWIIEFIYLINIFIKN